MPARANRKKNCFVDRAAHSSNDRWITASRAFSELKRQQHRNVCWRASRWSAEEKGAKNVAINRTESAPKAIPSKPQSCCNSVPFYKSLRSQLLRLQARQSGTSNSTQNQDEKEEKLFIFIPSQPVQPKWWGTPLSSGAIHNRSEIVRNENVVLFHLT